MAGKVEYPKWMYGPKGEAKVFQKDDIVPKGWEDHPDKLNVGVAKELDSKEPTPEEKAATIRDIRDAAKAEGIDIQLADDATVEQINAAIDKLTKR